MFQTQCDVLHGGGLCGMRSGIVTESCVGKSALQQECPQCDPVFVTGCLCEGRPVAGVLRLWEETASVFQWAFRSFSVTQTHKVQNKVNSEAGRRRALKLFQH